MFNIVGLSSSLAIFSPSRRRGDKKVSKLKAVRDDEWGKGTAVVGPCLSENKICSGRRVCVCVCVCVVRAHVHACVRTCV